MLASRRNLGMVGREHFDSGWCAALPEGSQGRTVLLEPTATHVRTQWSIQPPAQHHASHSAPVLPNPSLKLTRYGRRCKPGPRYPVHFLEPGLQHLPPRAA
jgi:hypothetical protein